MMDTGHLKRRNSKKVIKSLEEQTRRNKFKRRPVSFLEQYAQESTIHGISHVFKEGETRCHRATWALILVVSFSCALYLAINSWINKVDNPIALSITDTQYPLSRVWFPAVVLCPSNKILLNQANEYLSWHLKDKTLLNDSNLMDFYRSLALLQHPLYIQMENFLKNCDFLLPQLANINISALMHHSLPKCEDLFTICYWQGNQANCCQDIFRLQRSEEGFCYAFNSLTAEIDNASCKYFDAHNELRKKGRCELQKLISSGPATGLQVYFKVLDKEKYPSVDFTGGPKLKVQVFHPNDFPEPGIFNLVPLSGLNKLNVEVNPTVTMSKERIKRLNSEQRGCIFKEEVDTAKAKLTRSFSYASCIMECRMNYMLQKCCCLPYYLNKIKNESAPICNSMQLRCILNASSDLRLLKPIDFRSSPPSESTGPRTCGDCSPTCQEVRYDVDIWATMDLDYDSGRQRDFDGYIDVYYRNPGAVMYTRDVTYDFVTVIANIGGIGGLFLGGSILSLAEIFYWFSKAAIAFFWPNNRLEHRTISTQQVFAHLRH